MDTLNTDLATLLDVADEMNSPRMRAVVKRVEAELSRLREERKVLVGRSMEGWERAEAAETELRECRDSFTEVERVAMRIVALADERIR